VVGRLLEKLRGQAVPEGWPWLPLSKRLRCVLGKTGPKCLRTRTSRSGSELISVLREDRTRVTPLFTFTCSDLVVSRTNEMRNSVKGFRSDTSALPRGFIKNESGWSVEVRASRKNTTVFTSLAASASTSRPCTPLSRPYIPSGVLLTFVRNSTRRAEQNVWPLKKHKPCKQLY